MENVETRRNLYGFEFREADERRVDDPGERKTYDIKQMWQRSHEIVSLAARGFKNVQIAEILGIHPQTVTNTLNSQLGMQKLSELRDYRDEEAREVGEKIRILTKRALKVYHEILEREESDPDLKKKTADTVVLELSGLRVPTRIQSHNINTTLTKEELEEFKARGVKAARESGLIVDLPKCEQSEAHVAPGNITSKNEKENENVQNLNELED